MSRVLLQKQRETVRPRRKEGKQHNDTTTTCDHLAEDGRPFSVDAETLVARLDGDILEA